MINLYFGNYLLRNRLVDAVTLRSMLDIQQDTHLRLGVLAMHEGFMSASQVDEVNEAQKQMDARFGEIAVQKGYLNEADLDRLLTQQARGGAELTQMLIDQGVFSPHEMEKIVAAYRKENRLSDEEEQALQRGDVEQLMKPFVANQCTLAGIPHSGELAAYGSLFLRNMIRFIDRHSLLETEKRELPSDPLCAVEQVIQGALSLRTFLIMDEPTYCRLAGQHAKMTIDTMDELAEASVTEFLNLHNGLFSIWMSEQDCPITLQPPVTSSDLPDFKGEGWIQIPVLSGVGHVMVMVQHRTEIK